MKSYKRFIILFLMIFYFSTFLFSDQVTPGDRVKTHVNVREEPNSQSRIIGLLDVGDNALLLDNVPYWYKIKLSDDKEGFVSKAWTNILQGVSLITPSEGRTNLVIGSWNIKWFGSEKNDKHDYARMADIIQKFDLLAIQELQDPHYDERLNSIITELSNRGYRYTYVVSSLTGFKDNPDKNSTTIPKKDYLERYAFMWDIDRVELVNPSISYNFVSLPRINNDTFRQVPIYSDFRVKDGNGFDFRILTIHTVFNEKANSIRKSEIQFIHNWIIEQTTNPLNEEKNIIAIGDFNANPNGQPHHFDDIITNTSYRVLMNEPLLAGEPPLRTTIQRTNNPGPKYFKSPVYDHALVSNETSYALPNDPMRRGYNEIGVIDFDQEEHWQSLGNWNSVISAMSDHRPIWFKLDYMAEDKD